MLLKTSCKTIIFLLKKLKISKKIKKVNFKTRLIILYEMISANTLHQFVN
jgi:hypothetical protein